MKVRLLQELGRADNHGKEAHHQEAQEIDDEWRVLQEQIAAEAKLIRNFKSKITATKEINLTLGSKIEVELKRTESEFADLVKDEQELIKKLAALEAEVTCLDFSKRLKAQLIILMARPSELQGIGRRGQTERGARCRSKADPLRGNRLSVIHQEVPGLFCFVCLFVFCFCCPVCLLIIHSFVYLFFVYPLRNPLITKLSCKETLHQKFEKTVRLFFFSFLFSSFLLATSLRLCGQTGPGLQPQESEHPKGSRENPRGNTPPSGRECKSAFRECVYLVD